MFSRVSSKFVGSAIAAVIVAIALSMPVAYASDKIEPDQGMRLPCVTVPVSYEIFVEPHPENKRFAGSESIDVQVSERTRSFVLNTADLKVTDAECKSAGSSSLVKLKVHYQPALEEIVLELPRTVEPGRYVLSMKFHGKLNDESKGFFRTSFLDAQGNKHFIAATQMEPTNARRVFPCFDEPQYKATFKISTSIEPDDTAISNAPVLADRTDVRAKRKVVTFAVTPKMSTYLVALVVGRLVPSEVLTSDGVPIRIWCAPGKEKLTSFSHELAAKVLEYYTGYFDVKYPAQKLDLIALPGFSYGAMENLGAATFSEDNLLVDERAGSLNAKEQVAINVAHELAHMWFGDLVTMQWWDDIWLNEAFAEWMSTKAVDKLQPGWHYWNQFALERDQSMLSDSLCATRPIHQDVTNPEQIEQMFDEITYEKGASVLRMLERFVSEDKFRDGIRSYIKKYEFANATPQNLWSAIAANSGKDVSGIMHSWIYQKGFPLVSMHSSEPQLTLSQQRFAFEGNQQSSDKAEVWAIPMEVRSLDDDENSASKLLITNENAELSEIAMAPPAVALSPRLVSFSVPPPAVKDNPAPLLVNAGGEGYYRVRYTSDALSEIASHLYELTALERAAVLSDQFYLAISGQIPIKEYLGFTEAYKNETDPAVTSLLCAQFNQIDLLIDDSSRSNFAKFVCDRLSRARNSFNSFGWSSLKQDSDLIKRERAEVMLTCGTIGQQKKTIDEARALAEKLFAHDQEGSIDAELIEPIMKIVAYNGDAATYAKIEAWWHSAKSPERAHSALMSLAMFQDAALLRDTLKMCLTNKVSREDGPTVIAAIMETRTGRGVAWEFVRKHIIHVAWRFSEHRLYDVVMAMNSLATENDLSEVKAFFHKHPVPSQSQGISKIIEAIEVRVAFRQRSGTDLSSWLDAQAVRAQQIQLGDRISAVP